MLSSGTRFLDFATLERASGFTDILQFFIRNFGFQRSTGIHFKTYPKCFADSVPSVVFFELSLIFGKISGPSWQHLSEKNGSGNSFKKRGPL